MAKGSIAGLPLSRNEISLVAHQFERSFEYYIGHSSPFFTEYLLSLRTVVGLGFASVLENDGLLSVYQTYLHHFLAQNVGDFKACAYNKTLIAQSTAEMVSLAVVGFITRRHPRYYEDFLEALRYCIAKIPGAINPSDEIEDILRRLTVVF